MPLAALNCRWSPHQLPLGAAECTQMEIYKREKVSVCDSIRRRSNTIIADKIHYCHLESCGSMSEELILKNRLKEARAEKKLSQAALAEMVGVSRNTISSIETGQFNPTAKLALILCIALDKKFEDLFYF